MVDSGTERRGELAGFLRQRRSELVRADHDLPPIGRNRMIGLRREEVAFLSGVSVTWYTWLEQGREINPSRQVLDAIARTMRLNVVEHDYVLRLAGYTSAPEPTREAPIPEAPEHVRRLLDLLAEAPAFAIDIGWNVVAWNAAYAALFPRITAVADRERNLLRLIFTDPTVRDLLPDWEQASRHFLAEYRAEAGAFLGSEPHASLVADLLATSPEFQAVWDERRIERFATRERWFHTQAGPIRYHEHRLLPADVPGLHLVVYLPEPSAESN